MSDKILMPFSGGINSTYSLYRWLTETDAEVVVRNGVDRFESDDFNAKEFDRIQKISKFLKKEYRDFDLELGEFPKQYVKEQIPIRPGFKKGKYDIGSLRPRYAGYINWCFETGADGISIGICLENTATQGYEVSRRESGIENIGVDIYLGGVRELIPVSIGDNFNYDEVAKDMTGRFEQYEFLPKELQDLCIRNNSESRAGREMSYWKTYEKFIGEGKTGRDFDLYCAKHGSYGPWRHEADPETYMYRGRGEDGNLHYLLYE
jgi:hypothetical protein